MKSDWPQSEVDVGRALIPLLEKGRWEVYEEVLGIDLVCRRAREDGDGFDVMTIELTKGGPSFDKLGQAMAHKGKAQFVAWAMPLKRESRSRETASACSLAMGVSLIEVSPSECRTTWATQRDTLKSKLAQAVEALEATHAHVSDMLNAWADGHVTDCSGCPSRSNENARIEVLVRSTLTTLKDNPPGGIPQ